MAPKISIGMPVYNGENYLERAIECILAQTFEDFELIICDNASTDLTKAICVGHAARDKRIRYIRHAENIGSAANFQATFHESSGTYFKWAAHDDTFAPTYLEKTAALLDAAPNAVLAHSITEIVDPDGHCMEVYDHTEFGTSSPKRTTRLTARLKTLRCIEVFGLMRRDALAETELLGPHIAHDRTLLNEMALKGRFLGVPEPLFFNQDHEARFTRTFHGADAQLDWYQPGQSAKRAWRMWTIYAKAFRAVSDNLPLSKRPACYAILLRSIAWQSHWRGLIREPVLALAPGLRGLPTRLARRFGVSSRAAG
ncbi:MAG: glycosyltransferase family 2 protein [Geminicoccaceae bacterium]